MKTMKTINCLWLFSSFFLRGHFLVICAVNGLKNKPATSPNLPWVYFLPPHSLFSSFYWDIASGSEIAFKRTHKIETCTPAIRSSILLTLPCTREMAGQRRSRNCSTMRYRLRSSRSSWKSKALSGERDLVRNNETRSAHIVCSFCHTIHQGCVYYIIGLSSLTYSGWSLRYD